MVGRGWRVLGGPTDGYREGVGDVDRVINTKSSGEDDVDTDYHVFGDIPEVKSAHKVNQGEEDAGHHSEGEAQVAQHHQGDQADGEQG